VRRANAERVADRSRPLEDQRGSSRSATGSTSLVGVCRTNDLESPVIAGFVRGLSTRDVEASLAKRSALNST